MDVSVGVELEWSKSGVRVEELSELWNEYVAGRGVLTHVCHRMYCS